MSKSKYLTATDINKVLPAETAALFKVNDKFGKRTSTRIASAKYGVVDFKTLSVAAAKQLVKKEAPFIEALTKTTASKNDGKSATA